MSLESVSRLWAPDSSSAIQPAPPCFSATVNLLNQSVDLEHDFHHDGELAPVMQRSNSAKSLSAPAAARRSFESMDLDELKAQFDESVALQPQSKATSGDALFRQDADPCLGSAADRLPRQSTESVSEFFASPNFNSDYVASSRGECGFNEQFPMRDFDQRDLQAENFPGYFSCPDETNIARTSDYFANESHLANPSGHLIGFSNPFDGVSDGQGFTITGRPEWQTEQFSFQTAATDELIGAGALSGNERSDITAGGPAGTEESNPFYVPQGQGQQLEPYHSGSITNIACTLEYLAPLMTKEPQVPCQQGFDAEGRESPQTPASNSIEDSFYTVTDTQREQASSSAPPAPPAPPVIEGDDPLEIFFLPNFGFSSQPLSQASEVERKVQRIREIISLRRGIRPDILTKNHVLIHEVIHIILLSHLAGCPDLKNILSFCTEDGFEIQQVCSNFMVRDTKVMGLLWKTLKGNTNGDYDTFARAMRTCRGAKKDYFDYLSSGKGSRKRIYKLGARSLEEIGELSKLFRNLPVNSNSAI